MKRIKWILTGWIVLLLLLSSSCTQEKVVRFGVCADVHKDIMHDADQRLEAFVTEMSRENTDFIIQLGDFTQPQEYNASFMKVWNSFDGSTYHVLGNHDMDNSVGEKFSREYAVSFFDMPSNYYSFDVHGFHFIVLDGNDEKDPPQQGYAHFIGTEQLTWLKEDLSLTKGPVVIFSHQSIEDPGGVENAAEVRKILEESRLRSGEKKVIACFSGHHHIDYATIINGIHYIQINSMSYYWMGGDYLQVRYSEEIDGQYPWIKYTSPYSEPLFALVEIDARGTIRISGRESTWVGPDPWAVGYPEKRKDQIAPRISSKELEF